MHSFDLTGYLGFRDDFSLSSLSLLEVVTTGNTSWLYAGSSASGALNRISIEGSNALQVQDVTWQTSSYNSLPLSDGLVVSQNDDTCLISIDRMSGGVVVQDFAASGAVTTPTALRMDSGASLQATKMESVSIGNTTLLAAADASGAGLNLYQLNANWTVSEISSVRDSVKTTARDVSDLLAVDVSGTQYLVAASDSENGFTSYRMSESGDLIEVDAIGARDGLWVSGLCDIEQVSVGNQTFLIGAGAQSGTLSSVRINDMGVFFVADIEYDDRNTRFAGASALESFEVAERDFVVVGGTDGGVSLFEVLPGGDLFHIQNAVQSTEWDIGAISGLTTHVVGSQVNVFVSSSGDGGLAHLTLDLSDLGVRSGGDGGNNAITGTGGDDVLIGYSGNDTINGGDGDDIIFAGAGENRLYGGEGADVFVLTDASNGTRIEDFEHGVDQIHLGDWGMLYDTSVLDLAARNNGASISWRGNEVDIRTADRDRIETEDWSNEDFIF